jgi:16S rRNA pseudouridine516 synthase
MPPAPKSLSLENILYTQGFGSRRICTALVEAGRVSVPSFSANEVLVPSDEFSIQSLRFRVDDIEWPFEDKAYIALNKPSGIECSQKPKSHPSVYTLLPAPLRDRPNPGGTPGVQAVGRLDQDTTGLLLLSDDGKFIHRMSSPKHHVPKVYEVTTTDAISDEAIARLLKGVVLEDDPKPVRAAACVKREVKQLSLTLTEGKYHQVKRMIAAVGNHVEALHRSQVGGYVLPDDLKSGEWCWLGAAELAMIRGA